MRRRSVCRLLLGSFVGSVTEAADKITCFGLDWSVPILADWRVERDQGTEILRLVTPRPQAKEPRRPFQYALVDMAPARRVVFEADVQREAASKSASVILVYAWQGPGHFNYVHLSGDSASEQPVHNGVFHCYGGDRVRISVTEGPGALPTAGWHAVKLVYDASTGLVETSVDGVANASLRAVDLSLGSGRVGLGSFFNTGAFRRVRVSCAS